MVAYVQDGVGEIDLIPTQVYKLGRPQAVAEGDKDRGGIPVTPAIVPGGRHQALDLGVGQVFPRPLFSVWPTPWHLNCSIYDGWRRWLGGQFHHDFQWPLSNDCS
jgi:hypothetical protein